MNWKYSFLPDFHGPSWLVFEGSRSSRDIAHTQVGDNWGIPQIPCLRHTFPSLSTIHCGVQFRFLALGRPWLSNN